MELAQIGATARGGVNRQALSPEDAAARNLLAAWATARGFGVFTDAIGNLFVRREGSDAKARPVMSGSHMDSQPTGGRFDGMFGVLAAFEALEALEDARIKTKRPVIAVGSDADIVLFDPEERWTIRAASHHSRVDYSLFEGHEVTGRVKKVFLRGNLIVDGDKWLGRDGGGQYCRRGEAGRLS